MEDFMSTGLGYMRKSDEDIPAQMTRASSSNTSTTLDSARIENLPDYIRAAAENTSSKHPFKAGRRTKISLVMRTHYIYYRRDKRYHGSGSLTAEIEKVKGVTEFELNKAYDDFLRESFLYGLG